MGNPFSYRSTVTACYIGSLVQAIVVNFPPLLFLTFRQRFGLSFEQLGLLVTINFFAQVATDLSFSRLIDKHGFRPFVVTGLFAASAGLFLYGLTPTIFAGREYAGFIVSTIVFSIGGGLMEILISPIVHSLPSDNKSASMSLLHSFYAWGQAGTVLLTTFLLFFLPQGWWPLIAFIWALPPVADALLFTRVPMAPQLPEEKRTGMRRIFRQPFYFVALLVIMTGAIAEMNISQWASAFLERVMGLNKVLGDTLGMCLFGVTLGLGRLWYGKMGGRVRLHRLMMLGAALSVACYLTVAFSNAGWISLLACALAGLGASLLWPGTLSLSAERFPLASAAMFAILAASGDIGAAIGPGLLGVIAERIPRADAFSSLVTALGAEQLGLRAGMLLSAIFPAISFFGVWALHRHSAAALSTNQRS